LNILHLTPYYAPAYAFGGVTRAVEGMARALAERGHTVTVLTTDAFNQYQRYEDIIDFPPKTEGDVIVVRVRNRSVRLRGQFNLSTPLGMDKIATGLLKNVDILHVHEFRTAENLLVTPIAARLGIPMLLSPHGTLTLSTGRGTLKSAWDRLLSPAVARRFGAVVALTRQEAEEARAAWKSFSLDPAQTRFEVVPNGVNAEEFTHLSGREAFRARYGLSDAPVCLFLGRLHARKGIEVLVRAFKQANLPDARLLIVGPDEGMLALLQAIKGENTVITGYLDGQDRLAALAAADLFCLPATGEGLSMAALEALAAGLPAILSPGCNLPEVGEVGAGLIVEPQVEPLAQALRDLLSDAERRRLMGAAAQTLVRERFTWMSVAERLEAIYQQMAR
jgi:glycosyltransferase involved in cell wall biosynthesis